MTDTTKMRTTMAEKTRKISIKRIRQLMGRLVVVTKYGLSTCSGVSSIPMKPRAGWVVGVRWLRAGQGWESIEGHGPAVPHLLVAFWPSQNPVKVPMDGWRKHHGKGPRNQIKGHEVEPDPLPWDGQWNDEARACQRAEVRSCRRDEKGRFV